ncbi:MAG: methyltransferase family protein [Saprospiraceae bacterium]
MKLLLKNLLFTLFIPGTIGVYLPVWLGRRYEGIEGWWNWLGVLPLAIGFTIVLLSIWDFGKKGEGTPFPLDPPRNLVVGRFYKFSRNPMYLGVLSAIAGWAIWFLNMPLGLYWLAICLLFNIFVLFVEEPLLKKQFGESYHQYCQRVPRWF